MIEIYSKAKSLWGKPFSLNGYHIINISFIINIQFQFQTKMELPFEVLNQTDLDTERTKLNKNIQENIEY